MLRSKPKDKQTHYGQIYRIMFHVSVCVCVCVCVFLCVPICVSHSSRVTAAASLSHPDPLPPPSASTCQSCYIISVEATAAIKLGRNTFVFEKLFGMNIL